MEFLAGYAWGLFVALIIALLIAFVIDRRYRLVRRTKKHKK